MMHLIKKLKFFDYLIISIGILIVIIAYTFFNPEERWITIEVLDENIPISQAQSVKVGNFEKNPTGKTIAEIINYQLLDTPSINNSNKDALATVNLLITITPYSGEYEYKNKILKVGSPIELRLNQGIIDGVVSNVESATSPEPTTFTLTLHLYEQWPWYAESILIGASETDSNNKKIAEVISKEVTPAEVTVETAIGQKILTTNPQKVDITLKVKVNAQQYGNRYIFRKNTTLLIGDRISLNLGKTRLRDALITNIE